MHGDISYIGEKIKQLRKARSMTLLELSEYTGLSIGHLSQIERGKTVPNIEHLIGIAENLNVTITELIDPGVTEQNVIRANEAVVKNYPETNTEVAHYLFSRNPTDFQILTIKAGKVGEQPWSRHQYPEVCIVNSGQLTVFLDTQTFILEERDAIFIPANVRHKLINTADRNCVSTWIYLRN